MSLISIHYLRFDNAKVLLETSGACPPGSLPSLNGTTFDYDNLLQYDRCDAALAAEVKDYYCDLGHSKEDAENLCKWPIYFESDGNGVSWYMDDCENDTPALAISKLFPSKIMSYTTFTEDMLDGSCYLKDGENCTKDGRYVDAMLTCDSARELPGHLIQLSLIVDNTDKRKAHVYSRPEYVHDLDLMNGSERKILCIPDSDAAVNVYRVLSDGSKLTNVMSCKDLCEMSEQALEERIDASMCVRSLPNLAFSMDDESLPFSDDMEMG